MQLHGRILDAAGAVASIGNLVSLVQSSLSADWSGDVAFTSRAKELHSAMLAIQCVVGGAQNESRDLFGHVICPGGVKASCALSTPMLNEWRTLRDGFAEFWRAAAERGDYSNAEAQRLKDYAAAFYAFYTKVSQACARQGVELPITAPSAPTQQTAGLPKWVPWALVGVCAAGLAFVLYRR